MYKMISEMNRKSTLFLICFGLLAIGVAAGGDSSELRTNNSTDNMQNDG